ncbi:hypothetical protein [Noviherbaspirillum sp. ST9]|uniref:hypothetical protein n=1 Tax=Noviherbaspirillum sp. ST9 TaxID=3401606 RepID=UPI003B58A077
MKNFLCGFFFLICYTYAHSSTIDFEDQVGGNCESYGDGGLVSTAFYFTGNPDDPGLFICNPYVVAANYSKALLNANALSILTMRQNGGDTFWLSAFQAANRDQPELGYATTIAINVLGQIQGGGTVEQQLILNGNALTTFFLPSSFTNLTSVVFSAVGSGGSNAEFLIDNIVVNEQYLSEPVSLVLFFLGLLMLALNSRKRA